MGKKRAVAYPPPEQYENWQNHADELDMSVSQFVMGMVEAGRKKFDADVTADESVAELREQRNDLQEELTRTRARVEKLEAQLYAGERGRMVEFVRENPGCTFGEIEQRLMNTVNERLPAHIEEAVGEKIERRDGKFYPVENDRQ